MAKKKAAPKKTKKAPQVPRKYAYRRYHPASHRRPAYVVTRYVQQQQQPPVQIPPSQMEELKNHIKEHRQVVQEVASTAQAAQSTVRSTLGTVRDVGGALLVAGEVARQGYHWMYPEEAFKSSESEAYKQTRANMSRKVGELEAYKDAALDVAGRVGMSINNNLLDVQYAGNQRVHEMAESMTGPWPGMKHIRGSENVPTHLIRGGPIPPRHQTAPSTWNRFQGLAAMAVLGYALHKGKKTVGL